MSWNNGGYSRSRGDDSMAMLNIMLLGSLIEQARGANAAPEETLGEPSSNPGETQPVPKPPENGALAAETPPFFPGKAPEYGGVDGAQGCAICTPADVTHRHVASRSDSVTSRDGAVTTVQGWCNWCGLPETVIPSQRQSHVESLPRSLPETPTQESAPMIVNPSAMPSDAMSQQQVRALNAEFDAGRVTAALTGQVLRVPKRADAGGPTAAQVQALTGALDAAGKLHAQAFGSSTIRGLIEELGKCQQALAGFLPAIPENIPGMGAGDQGGIFSTLIEGPENFPDPHAPESLPDLAQRANPVEKIPQGASSNPPENFPEGGQSAPRTGPGAVHALVSSALQAHDSYIEMLQAESVHLRVQIEQWTARRRELLDFLQTGVARA